MVVEKFEGVATLDKRQPLRDQPLQFDRPNFRTVLFGVGTTLRGFVVVEVSADTLRLAVEEIDEGPKQIGEISLQAGVEKEPDKASTVDSSAREAASEEGRERGSGSSSKGDSRAKPVHREGEKRAKQLLDPKRTHRRAGKRIHHSSRGSFASGRADRGLTAISSHGRIAPHPKGRNEVEDVSRRLVCARGMPEAQA